MEANICCAYNVSRSCNVSSKVTVADRTDQPLTILRLLVEGLGFKAATGLWLKPLHGAPQLVRPFPFDLVYLDANMRVIEAVELLPEVPLPPFDDRATSALILPVSTISSTGIQRNDEMVICSKEELEDRIAIGTEESALLAVSSASSSAAVSGRPETAIATIDPSPVPDAIEVSSPVEVGSSTPVVPPIPIIGSPVFAPMRTSTAAPIAGFTAAITTTWQVAGSTMAVMPDSDAVSLEPEASEVQAEDAPFEGRSVADEIASARLDSIEPEKKEEDESPAILDTTAAESVSMTALELPDPVLESAPKAVADPVEGSESVGPQVSPVAKEERPLSPKAKSDAREFVATPSVAPEQVQLFEANKSRTPTIVQKAAAPENPESPREKVARVAPAAVTEEPKTKSTDKKKRKQSFGDLVKGFLNCPDPPPEYRDGSRLVQQGLLAKDRTDSVSGWMEVRDVSPSGFYLRTKKQCKLGNTVSLTLQRKGAPEVEFESCVDVQGKVVRCDEGGVGLMWVFPKDLKFQPWERLHTKRSDESDIQYFIREIRMARALHFLQRICPLASEEIRHAFIDRLSNKRVSSAVEIALQAEHALAPDGKARKVLVHSDVLMKIVESGSWIEDNWIRKMWAGLLVSSCDADGQDTSNLTFIDLLARLTPIHLRILSFVCKKYEETAAEEAAPGKLDVYCTAEELTIATDSHSFARIQQTVGQLSGVGLLVESARPSYFSVSDKEKTRTTPTTLGLKMYMRCHGRHS